MTDTFEYDLVCIGSGPAGQRAAVQAAKVGRRAAVIERRGSLGGVCLDTGTIPSKTFREAVLWTVSTAAHADASLESGASARPTAEALLARVQDVVSREASVIANQLRRNGVDVLWGEASFRDPHRVAVHNGDTWREITAANVLIAVGTAAAAAPGAPVDGTTILTSDDIRRLTRIPRSIAVVGAGVIGIEYASMFAALGVDVTVVDQRERPLEFLDSEIVDELIHQMRKRNVYFRGGEAVARLGIERRPAGARRARARIGQAHRRRHGVVFRRRVGATASLGLEHAGLCADERGRIAVDRRVPHDRPAHLRGGRRDRLSEPGRHLERAGPAGRLPRVRRAGPGDGASTSRSGSTPSPKISMVGATEHELTKAKVPYEVGVARYREIARGQILGDDSGFFKMLFHRENRRLLGVHIIGTGATELIHIGQAVLGLGGGLDYFLETVFNYPTLAECYKVAALNAANKLSTSGA